MLARKLKLTGNISMMLSVDRARDPIKLLKTWSIHMTGGPRLYNK